MGERQSCPEKENIIPEEEMPWSQRAEGRTNHLNCFLSGRHQTLQFLVIPCSLLNWEKEDKGQRTACHKTTEAQSGAINPSLGTQKFKRAASVRNAGHTFKAKATLVKLG